MNAFEKFREHHESLPAPEICAPGSCEEPVSVISLSFFRRKHKPKSRYSREKEELQIH